jgi:hypothetical protein
MKRFKNVVMALALVLPGLALAQSGTNLSCPAGTVQAGGPSSGLEATFCAVKGTQTAHGPYLSLDKDGRVLAQGQFENGFRTGTWIIYDATGAKTAEIEFARGDFHGRKVSFHKNGRKAVEENYVMGRREGDLRKFDTTGEVVSVQKYRGNLQVQ